jgi:choice-of-anchor B domain-containing protein
MGGEMFGSALAVRGNEILVGAPGYGEREGVVWRFGGDILDGHADVQFLSPRGLQYRSSFGSAMAASDNLILVGAVGHDNFEGAVFPFTGKGTDLRAGDPMINNSGQFASVTGGAVECSEGAAEDFGCSEVDMLSFLSRDDIGARRGIQVNDVWGWEDPDTGKEYAIVGRTDGTSFIDLSDPYNPVYLGDLPKTSTANQSIWRDIKVYKNHAFIVSDGAGAHHMQIFDLAQLRRVTSPPATFEVTALYKGIYSSHNIVINEETGFAYAVGSDSGGESCGGALHMINIQDPVNPTFAGCFADLRTGRGTGATHDAQCVLYHGPDADYSGREVCLSSNGSALSIADVTDKDNPKAISIAEYPNVAYTHQGWLTEDHRYFYLNDEGDEVSNLVEGTRTLILDLADLDDPVVSGEYVADHNSIDHNLYVRGNTMYQTNYSAGLRLLDISDPEKPVEVGHFDTVPYGKNDNSPVLGAWSNYPYFKSGVIVVTSGREGVFFLKKRSIDI